MATYVKNTGGYITPTTFTEPCMNCYASVTYSTEEVIEEIPSKTNAWTVRLCKPHIICPCCGKKNERALL